MKEKENIIEEKKIECSVCLKEIPKSSAKVSEAQDYLQYFCGIECYQEWQDKQQSNTDQS